MKRAIVIGSTGNLIEEVASRITGNSRDLGSTMVVFPGRRPRYVLLRSLARRIGGAFVPPRIFSLDGFVEFLYREGNAEAGVPMSDIDAAALLFHFHQSHPAPYGGSHYLSFPAFFPLGRKVFSEFEELVLAGVTSSRFRLAVGESGRNELKPIGDLFEQFYAHVKSEGLTTRAVRYDTVSHGGAYAPLDDGQRIVIAGVHDATMAVLHLLRPIVRRDNVHLMLQDGPQTGATLRALEIEAEYLEGPKRSPSITMVQGTDSHAQVFGASGMIHDLLDANIVLDENTVLVLPEAGTLFPVVHHILPLFPEGKFNISLGYPVTRTPVFGFLESLMHLVAGLEEGRLYAPDYLKFALHPFTKNILWRDREEVTRILFHVIEKTFAGSKAKRFFTLDDLENESLLQQETIALLGETTMSPNDVRDHLGAIHRNTIGLLSAPGNVGDFADRVIRVLSYMTEHSTAHRYWLYGTFVSTLTRVLEELSSSTVRSMVLRSPSEYFRFLRSFLETVRVPFQGTPLDGVQVLGFPETRNISFKRVIVFDANDDILPGAPQHHIVPAGLRSILGLPTAADAERSTEHDFSTLVNSAEEVLFFFTAKGRREKSRYLERMIWREQKDSGELPVDALHYATHLDTTTPVAIHKTGPVLEMLRSLTFSATALDTYLHCGLQFYYRYVLRLQERAGLTAEIERSDIGSFVHRILALYMRPAVGRELTEEDLDQGRLTNLIEEQFASAYGEESVGGRFLMKNQIQRHLSDFLREYQTPIVREEHPVLEGLETRWEATLGGATFNGFIDRIEKRGRNVFILDYKTGSRTDNLRINFRKLVPDDRTTWPQAIGSFQLPLYLLLYQSRTGVAREEIVPAHLMLGKNRLGKEIERPLFEKGGAESYLVIETILFALVEEIRDEHHPFLPTADVTTYCSRCPFTTICGTRWVETPQFY